MKRALVISAILLFGMTNAWLRAVQQPFPDTPIEVQRIADNLYALRGGGPLVRTGNVTIPASGTSLALVTGTGVILVDSKLPGSGAALLQAVRTISDKPVTMIINTHTHGDHVGGNPDFPPTVDVIAQETTAALMREWRPVSGGRPEPNLFAGKNGQGLPTRYLPGAADDRAGERQIDLVFFWPRPHRRRYVGRLPLTEGRARGRCVCTQDLPYHRHQQRRQCDGILTDDLESPFGNFGNRHGRNRALASASLNGRSAALWRVRRRVRAIDARGQARGQVR